VNWQNARKEPEKFSEDTLVSLEHEKKRKQFETMMNEIKQVSQNLPEILRQLRKLESEFADFDKPKPRERVDLSKEIESELRTGSRTFGELLQATGANKATLSRHLDELVQQGKSERNEVGRNVVYSLKPVQTGQDELRANTVPEYQTKVSE
jgi:DNA-binding transcriptional ArsR family regulator